MFKLIVQKFPRATMTIASIVCFGTAYSYYNATLHRVETEHPERIGVVQVFPMMISLGLLMAVVAIGGERVKKYVEQMRTRKKTTKDWLLFALFLAPGFAGYFWLMHQLKLRGYGDGF